MRLNKSSKKADLESSPSIGIRAKNGDDPPAKKIKVKFGAGSLAVASAPQQTATTTTATTPTTISTLSEQGKKDGDTG
jgi:protein phosphatase-4 regulatory subunit 3